MFVESIDVVAWGRVDQFVLLWIFLIHVFNHGIHILVVLVCIDILEIIAEQDKEVVGHVVSLHFVQVSF